MFFKRMNWMVMLHDCEDIFGKLRVQTVWKAMCINENDSKTMIFVMRIKALTEYSPWPVFCWTLSLCYLVELTPGRFR